MKVNIHNGLYQRKAVIAAETPTGAPRCVVIQLLDFPTLLVGAPAIQPDSIQMTPAEACGYIEILKLACTIAKGWAEDTGKYGPDLADFQEQPLPIQTVESSRL